MVKDGCFVGEPSPYSNKELLDVLNEIDENMEVFVDCNEACKIKRVQKENEGLLLII